MKSITESQLWTPNSENDKNKTYTLNFPNFQLYFTQKFIQSSQIKQLRLYFQTPSTSSPNSPFSFTNSKHFLGTCKTIFTQNESDSGKPYIIFNTENPYLIQLNGQSKPNKFSENGETFINEFLSYFPQFKELKGLKNQDQITFNNFLKTIEQESLEKKLHLFSYFFI